MKNLKIKAPRLNTNDDELLVLKIFVKKDDPIKKNQKIFLLETSKTSIEINSEHNGLIKNINVNENDYIKVGDVLMEILTDSHIESESEITNKISQPKKENKRVSLKALKLIKENGININDLGNGNKEIKYDQVLKYIQNKNIFNKTYNTKLPSVIVGTGLHAKEIASLLKSLNVYVLGFSSNNENEIDKFILDELKVICKDDNINKIEDFKNKNYYIGIGGPISNLNRKKIFEKFEKMKINLPPLISSKANISRYSKIGDGTVILPGATIGPDVVIGKNCIINCNSVVSHGSSIGNHVHLTPGSIVAGDCKIGDLTTIGMNSTVLYSTTVGKNCLTHNNSSVVVNLDDNSELNQSGKIIKKSHE